MMKNKHKTIKFICIIFLMFFCFIFMTTVYSAIFSTMVIGGDAYARAVADVRITDFRLATLVNSKSSFEEFGKSHVVTEVELYGSSSSASYYVDVTNYGSVDIGIFDITGLPDGVNYSISDYNLKDKVCNNSGKCNGFVTKTFLITLSSVSSYTGVVQLNFDFREFHNINYLNLSSNVVEVMDGDSISIDLGSSGPKFIDVRSSESIDYSYANNVLVLNNVSSALEIKSVDEFYYFEYKKNYEEFVVPTNGIYKIELWGASGGDDMLQGVIYPNTIGLGGYTAGNIELSRDSKLYVYVGGRGGQPVLRGNSTGGYNGGGTGSHDTDDEASGGGGGATDVRLVSGVWNDAISLKSRIMVAAGGASARVWIPSNGKLTNYYSPYCSGGGLVGYSMVTVSMPGKQTSGYAFGYGQDGTKSSRDNGDEGGGDSGLNGAGGGYYGGYSPDTEYYDAASGGSSFISGHNGCVAIQSSSSLTPRKGSSGQSCSDGTTDIVCSYHYSNYIFTNTIMIDGVGYNWTTVKGSLVGMPTFDGTSTMTGNTGNGYAKITLLETR